MDHGRDAAQHGAEQRRNGGIAAEADHGGGSQPAEQAQRLHGAAAELERGAGYVQGVAPREGRARHDMGGVPGKFAVTAGAFVGDEIDRDAATRERDRERLGRKQVPPGPARRHDDERRTDALRHQAALPAAPTLPSPACGGG